ncbi:MAG: hypothetical protein RIE23_07800 [Pontimonas sp.]
MNKEKFESSNKRQDYEIESYLGPFAPKFLEILIRDNERIHWNFEYPGGDYEIELIYGSGGSIETDFVSQNKELDPSRNAGFVFFAEDSMGNYSACRKDKPWDRIYIFSPHYNLPIENGVIEEEVIAPIEGSVLFEKMYRQLRRRASLQRVFG